MAEWRTCDLAELRGAGPGAWNQYELSVAGRALRRAARVSDDGYDPDGAASVWPAWRLRPHDLQHNAASVACAQEIDRGPRNGCDAQKDNRQCEQPRFVSGAKPRAACIFPLPPT